MLSRHPGFQRMIVPDGGGEAVHKDSRPGRQARSARSDQNRANPRPFSSREAQDSDCRFGDCKENRRRGRRTASPRRSCRPDRGARRRRHAARRRAAGRVGGHSDPRRESWRPRLPDRSDDQGSARRIWRACSTGDYEVDRRIMLEAIVERASEEIRADRSRRSTTWSSARVRSAGCLSST